MPRPSAAAGPLLLGLALLACPERPSTDPATPAPLPKEAWGTIEGDAPVTTSNGGAKLGPNAIPWRDVLSRQPLPTTRPELRGTILRDEVAPDVVLDGFAYIGAGSTLKAIDLADGSERWSKEGLLDAGMFAGARHEGTGTVLCGLSTAPGLRYRCVKGDDGSELWGVDPGQVYPGGVDVLARDGRVHLLLRGDYATPHLILDLADGTVLHRDDRASSFYFGLVDTGDAVLVLGQAGLVAKSFATGATLATAPATTGTPMHVFSDANGHVFRFLATDNTSTWLRYAAGAFTDVTGSFTSLAESMLAAGLTGQQRYASVGAAGSSGAAYLTSLDGRFLCRLDVAAGTLAWCTSEPGASAVKRWQVAPNGVVGASSFMLRLFDLDTGRAFLSGQTHEPLFFYERWAFGESGQWYGGR